jgi:hypothetical protein
MLKRLDYPPTGTVFRVVFILKVTKYMLGVDCYRYGDCEKRVFSIISARLDDSPAIPGRGSGRRDLTIQ